MDLDNDEKVEIELNTPQQNHRASLSSTYKTKSEVIEINEIIYENAPIHQKICCYSKPVEWKNMPDRKILTNLPDMALPNNKISTSKYTLVTFVPKNIFEQFSKMANMYFLVIGFLQLIKEISTSSGVPVTWAPLSFILFISALKDLFEDLKRHKSDNEENKRKTNVLRDFIFKETAWEDLNVGDIISLNQDEYFPADVLLMRSSEPKGVCYIETKNLDGETNLKQKKAHPDLDSLKNMSESQLFQIRGVFNYEKPNPYLYSFNGSIEFKKKSIPLDSGNFVLRGCSLRNTKNIIGVVAYTGHDTKIMLNSVKARPKRSKVEKTMNILIITVFCVQILTCVFSALYSAIWYEMHKYDLLYLDIDLNGVANNTFYYNFFVRMGNWIIIFQNFVPISLLVTLETVKFLQGIIISKDEKLKHKLSNTYVSVQTSNLNEELGQIEYIFSDKTGTLTCNIMEFKCFCVDGVSFGEEKTMTEDEVKSKKFVTNVDFKDKKLFDCLDKGEVVSKETLLEAFFSLALCHTIITEEKDNEIVYNASSPDELALVNFAKYCGIEYIGSDEDQNMLVQFDGEIFKYKLLNVLEFNSSRKRQSVIVQDVNKKIILYCKGADSVIEKRMNLVGMKEIKEMTWKNLERYANTGLRTLVIAKREIPENIYNEWAEEYLKACTSINDREKLMEASQEKIEKELILLGATAIEDKLQDEVGDTIAKLKAAGIKVWVLTGDKIETAINIGYSCQLLNDELEKIYVDGVSVEEVDSCLEEGIKKAQDTNKKFALIISGDALIHGAKHPYSHKIIQICENCSAVIACRVSPKQKQEIVSLVRSEKPKVSTLAVGDGANDVNMISAAHVGVGIKGVEGQQAARASDYVVGEFKTLRRLILFYGTESYRKNSHLICYNFFKNIILVLPPFWFAFLNGFSGQTIYDPILFQLYNICYSSLPIVVYSLFDKEKKGREYLKNPDLYAVGPKDLLFNKLTFWSWIFYGVWQSLLLTLPTFYAMEGNFIYEEDGYMFNFWTSGMTIFGYVIIVANVKVLLFSNRHSILSLTLIFGSILVYYITYAIASAVAVTYDLYNGCSRMFDAGVFYVLLIWVVVATSLMDLAIRRIKSKTFFNIAHKAPISIYQTAAKSSTSELNSINNGSPDAALLKKSYTGYAFSKEDPPEYRSADTYYIRAQN